VVLLIHLLAPQIDSFYGERVAAHVLRQLQSVGPAILPEAAGHPLGSEILDRPSVLVAIAGTDAINGVGRAAVVAVGVLP
jgi:hypothetical protein